MRVECALLLLAATLLSVGTATAQTHAQTITSEKPDTVTVSIYRALDRNADEALNLGWLQGYALITETRTVMIPEGRAVIRFEGVAGRILPESAIVTGLPDGVREKNLDAELLSERSLYERSLGRPVTIRRTRDGTVHEERAIIRSSADGAAIFETASGFFAADCRQQDAIIYDRVPAGLSAKPTLSIETESAHGGQVTLTLSYLAWGFDWQANYVATMRPDGKSADIAAWVTLANGDVTSFADANAMVIAGVPNREEDMRPARYREERLVFGCLTLPSYDEDDHMYAPPPPPPPLAPAPAPVAAVMERAEEIVVMRAMVQQEYLGDLKLYRVPHRTSVAAMSQKQVALLDQPSVPVEVIHRSSIVHGIIVSGHESGVEILLRAQNKQEFGLGIPLPQGPVAVFTPRGDRRLLLGEGNIADKAVGEEVEVTVAEATQVTAELEDGSEGKNWSEHVLTVRNANPFAIRYEAELVALDYKLRRTSTKLVRRKGIDVWIVDVPAGGTATLSYRMVEPD